MVRQNVRQVAWHKPTIKATIYEKKDSVIYKCSTKDQMELMVLAECVLESVLRDIPKDNRKDVFDAVCGLAWEYANKDAFRGKVLKDE